MVFGVSYPCKVKSLITGCMLLSPASASLCQSNAAAVAGIAKRVVAAMPRGRNRLARAKDLWHRRSFCCRRRCSRSRCCVANIQSQKKGNLICHAFLAVFVVILFLFCCGDKILNNNTDNVLDIEKGRRHFMVNLQPILAMAKWRLLYLQFS